jgi:hypothetical protein
VHSEGGAQFSLCIAHKIMAANSSRNVELLDKSAYKYFSLDFVSPLLLNVRDDITKRGNTANETRLHF